MAGHKIRNEILFKSRLLTELEELLLKLLEHLDRRLTHHSQRVESAVLRRNLELSGGVMCNELTEEGIVLVKYEVIKSYAGSYKDLLNTLDAFDLTEHMSILGVIDLEVLTRSRCKALLTGTNATLSLLIARGISEVSGGTANVVDIALEVGHCGNYLCLIYYALFTS